MAVTKDDVLLLAPELSSVTDDNRWDAVINDAYLQLNPDVFEEKTDLAAKLLVAHMLTISRWAETGRGQIEDESVGQVRRRYAVSKGGEGAGQFGSTPYGLEFRRLQRQLGYRVGVT